MDIGPSGLALTGLLYHLATLDELASILMFAQKFATLFLEKIKCKVAPLRNAEVKLTIAKPNAALSAAVQKGAPALQRGFVAGSWLFFAGAGRDAMARRSMRRSLNVRFLF